VPKRTRARQAVLSEATYAADDPCTPVLHDGLCFLLPPFLKPSQVRCAHSLKRSVLPHAALSISAAKCRLPPCRHRLMKASAENVLSCAAVPEAQSQLCLTCNPPDTNPDAFTTSGVLTHTAFQSTCTTACTTQPRALHHAPRRLQHNLVRLCQGVFAH